MDKAKLDKYLKLSTIVVVSMIIGSLITMSIDKKSNSNNNKSDNNTVSEKELEPLYEVYSYINTKYYKKISKKKLVDGAINGMLKATGDKHTNYLNKKQKKEFEEELKGSYYGIGVVIGLNKEKEVYISRIFKESPAEKENLKVNDVFLEIDGKSVKGKSTEAVSDIIKSKKNSTVKLTLRRDGKEKKVSLKKENITLFSVSSEIMNENNKKIGYIEVGIFGENTFSQFLDELNKLEEKKIDSLIIDLRGNSGGYLTVVTQMLSLFMDSDTVIYKIRTKNNIEEYKSIYKGKKDIKVSILVDQNSASASEIMTSSMKEKYGAIVVGKTTYGKGTVQTTTDLSNDGLLKYTIQEWLTPNGNSIDSKGVKPDYDVELGDEYKNNPVKENDNQLKKAIEVLTE